MRWLCIRTVRDVCIFFDPLFGVVQADSFSNMSHFLADVFKRDVGTHWRGTEQRLQLSEMVPRADFHLR